MNTKSPSDIIRWGIYGPGGIANKFADAVTALSDAEVIAVAGRTSAKAADFAQRHQIPHALDGLDELVQHPEVDAVYVATTHNVHFKATCAALEAGKPVLCEKPLAMNAQQAQHMIQLAQRQSLFLMEAMWTRFLPAWRRVRALLDEEAIGTLRVVTAEFGICAGPNANSRLIDKALAGGALLDAGVYPIALSQYVFGGQPESIRAQAVIGDTDVDELTLMTMKYARNRMALLGTAARAKMDNRLVIAGDPGFIKVPAPFLAATKLTWSPDGKTLHEEDHPHRHNGFEEQIEEAGRCIRAGLIESPTMPHQDSLIIAETMDEVRRQIGLSYPADDDMYVV